MDIPVVCFMVIIDVFICCCLIILFFFFGKLALVNFFFVTLACCGAALWLCTGDLKNEDSVLEWLVDDENRELADEIEAVNGRMLERLLDESPFLAVFFCKYFINIPSTLTLS